MIAEVVDGRKNPPPIPYNNKNRLMVTGVKIYCNHPKLVYAIIIIINPMAINIVLLTREINFPAIFETSTNPKGDVKFTKPTCQEERGLIFSNIYGGIINPKDVVPPKINIANIGEEKDIFLNNRKSMMGLLFFNSHIINRKK